jgi:actin related protein 2/3 complex subunit 1A/1B
MKSEALYIYFSNPEFKADVLSPNRPPATVWWGPRLPFNTLCAEYSTPSGGWVHTVAFSPSGDALAFAGHDSSITFAYPNGEGQPPLALFTIRLHSLPYVTLTWPSENTLVAAGHDCEPVLFTGDAQSGWRFVKSLDDPSARSASVAQNRTGGVGRLGGNEAFNRFRAADSRGVSAAAGAGAKVTSGGTERTTVHQNTITSVRPYSGAPGQVDRVSTSGVDGRIVVWQL